MNESTHRGIDLSVEVPGTPEEVWVAIATGPGVTAWMHPTEIGEHEGGRYAFDMGSGMNESGVVTAYERPHRFATKGVEWQPSADAEPAALATEWLIEGRDGGTSVVRLVMSGFGDGQAWDDEIAGMTDGMWMSMDTLRRYLTYFAGERASWIRCFGHATGSREDGWRAYRTALGAGDEGSRVEVEELGLSGSVERVYDGRFLREVLIRTTKPGPGFLSALLVGEGNWVNLQASLYGPEAAAIAEREEPRWRAWVAERFPTKD